ncbi:hypothetical protein [Streptomyces sp. NPDC056549]|uniref:hypothetical protein n=1 Tax=Streptomyces sp. NPDC056549 TaxID=3345864 RepID=UPI0036908BCA
MADLYNNSKARQVAKRLVVSAESGSPFPNTARGMLNPGDVFEAVVDYMRTGDYAVRCDFEEFANRRFDEY